MQEIHCPSCRLRLWAYQVVRRDVPAPDRCRACSGPVDDAHMVAARLTARITRDHGVGRAERESGGLLERRPVAARGPR